MKKKERKKGVRHQNIDLGSVSELLFKEGFVCVS